MEAFFGTWKQESVEGLDEVLVRLGYGYVARKAGKALHLTLKISSPSPDVYSIVTSRGGMKLADVAFKLGELYEEPIPGGRKAKVRYL